MRKWNFIFVLILALTGSCSSADTENEIPPADDPSVLNSFKVSDCKDLVPDEAPVLKTESRESVKENIPDKTTVRLLLKDSQLRFKLENIYQNCAFHPEVKFSKDGKIISFDISRRGRLTDCRCFFDIDADVSNFSEGEYEVRIRFSDWRILESDPVGDYYTAYEFSVVLKEGVEIVREEELFRIN